MKLLLDTHIWLWSVLEESRLSAKIAKALANPVNEVWISPVSIWEILTLCKKGRLMLEPDAHRWVSETLALVPFKQATFTHEVALATEQIELPHRDPADRFLAATAMINGLTLVTADQNLLRGSGFKVLGNH
jgi:PIN domain nuclease of toxin-antitoxin system